jgi:hypothetical protein
MMSLGAECGITIYQSLILLSQSRLNTAIQLKLHLFLELGVSYILVKLEEHIKIASLRSGQHFIIREIVNRSRKKLRKQKKGKPVLRIIDVA